MTVADKMLMDMATTLERLRLKPFRVGTYLVDPQRNRISSDENSVRIEPKTMDVLLILCARLGEVVSKDEILHSVWPGTFITENVLTHAVWQLRKALDDAELIEAVPKRGYRVTEEVHFDDPADHTSVAGLRERSIETNKSSPQIRALAVLPLTNLSGDPQEEYFADGMTEELITTLAKIGNLKVISRTSVMQYKGVRKTATQIANELNVDVLVEGSVLRKGRQVRINAQLIQAATDQHLWAESYLRDLCSVLSLQGQIASDIAERIRATITPAERIRLASSGLVNPEAYEAYLKGRFHWYNVSGQGFDEAERYFQLALEKDQNFALAYAGLADVWLMRADIGQESPSKVIPKARTAALKAEQLDPTLSEPHVTMGNIAISTKRDWASAEQEFRLAIKLNPSSRDAHFMYADYLISCKRNREWESEIQQTLALDPVSSFARTFYGWHLIYLVRYDEAIEVLQRALALRPGFASAEMGLWGAYYKKRMEAQAMREAIKFFQAIKDDKAAAALNTGYRQAGYKEGMKRAADLLARRTQEAYVPGIRIARLYAHAGDANRTLFWLNKAEKACETPLLHLNVAWDWDFLRSDPRFTQILRRMNFPPP